MVAGPWMIPDDAHKTIDDREPDAVVIENTIAKSTARLKVFLGQADDPDADGHNWYPVFGDYDG